MKKGQITIALLLFSFLCATSFSATCAVHFSTAPQDSFADITIAAKKTTPHHQGLFKSWMEKRLLKKMLQDDDDQRINKLSRAALAFGLISLGVLVLAFLAGALSLILGALVFSILGIVFSIKTFNNINKSQDPAYFYRAKRKAIWGLVLSMLALALPVAAAIALVILFSNY